ncbi:MAG: hypothetical protein NPINA01_25530 [Nitrospinaceae bacterium]|nr:MAG: hypothetical protein NPINA01_25530 [Nitrospinaceae bacterium]
MHTSAFAGDCSQPRKTQQAPANIYNQANPLPPTPENISVGELLYQKDAKPLACAQCHGPQGDGKGVMGSAMNPKPRDFTCSQMMKDLADGQLFWIIKNGSSGTGMMAFKGLKDEQVWQIVHYLRLLAK